MGQHDPELRSWLKKEKDEERKRAVVSAGLERMEVSDFTSEDIRALLSLSGLPPASRPMRISALSRLERRVRTRKVSA